MRGFRAQNFRVDVRAAQRSCTLKPQTRGARKPSTPLSASLNALEPKPSPPPPPSPESVSYTPLRTLIKIICLIFSWVLYKQKMK